jgi:hypothetical protein
MGWDGLNGVGCIGRGGCIGRRDEGGGKKAMGTTRSDAGHITFHSSCSKLFSVGGSSYARYSFSVDKTGEIRFI